MASQKQRGDVDLYNRYPFKQLIMLAVIASGALAYLVLTVYIEVRVTRSSPRPLPVRKLQWPKKKTRFDTNFLGKMWDKAIFDEIEPAAFENFKAYNNTNRPLDMGLTSYNMTVVKLISPTSPRIRVGDVLKYRIESRDFKGRNRIVGGDFWYATLTSDRSPKASTTGYIADYGNGTYDAFVLAAWPGSAKFNLILVHTSETVYHMRSTVWNSEGRLFFRGYYRFNGKKADVRCSMRRQGTWEGMCDYPAYKSLGSTVLLCEHKAGFPCESLVSLGIDSKHISYSANQMAKGIEYLYKSPYYWKSIPLTTASIKVEGSTLSLNELEFCEADQQIPKFHGYWMDGKWHSLLCKFSDWTENPIHLHSCLRNKFIAMLGDSTARQLRDSLIKVLGKSSKATGTPLWSKNTYDALNLVIYWQFHGYVIASHSHKIVDWKEEVDALNELNSTKCNYIVLINQWAHFTQWTRDSYIERVRLIRRAVIDLLQRCPDVPVVIKGPHPKQHKSVDSIIFGSDYFLKDIELINQEAFQGTGAFFLPVWDMNLAYPSGNHVHMPMQVVREELKMFLGYACDKLTRGAK